MIKKENEGGCGVIGIACAEKLPGRHLLVPLEQMCNRGNDKGGGIAAVGLEPSAFGVSQEVLENNYLLAIGYLDRSCQAELEKKYIHPLFEVDHIYEMPCLKTYKKFEAPPPEVVVYFVRVKQPVADADQAVYQNTYQLNCTFYSATGEKKAFVLSHGKNMIVLKMVGYGNDVIRYYQLENFLAHVWIGHHRYPTKGRVWHPGGAHPFIGLNEALVHNGDFANYFSICEYLAQKNIHPHFLTDTEVAALLFDLYYRTYQYPLEYVIEAFAPTTERDFFLLPEEKQTLYKQLQQIHIHGSPDGPWFFLIAQSLEKPAYRLIGITDTSMLRPQVFALQTGLVPIGFAASEKQAIDAALHSLAEEDSRFWPCADVYWNARGGSFTDGGAFSFTVTPQSQGQAAFACTDKFENPIHNRQLNPPYVPKSDVQEISIPSHFSAQEIYDWAKESIPQWNYQQVEGFLKTLRAHHFEHALDVVTWLLDHRYPMGNLRRSSLDALFNKCISQLLPNWNKSDTAILDGTQFPSEGENSLARQVVKKYKEGFKKIILFNCRGQRFIANGLGPQSFRVRIDVYGSSGDYLASGIDGAEVYVHGSAQDQLGQIVNDGSLVVYGDVGQTFMYGAKGGKAFVLGNTAGRPLINAVGKPRVVINGTCLDYLAESFMAGNPIKDGGFVIINGIKLNENGEIEELDTPYPGSSLFSLASGGAIYIRDPGGKVTSEQLNGGEFAELTHHEWGLILPYLEENQRLFEIPVSRLLEYEGKKLSYHHVYRKIHPAHVRELQEEEAWVKVRD